MSNYFSGVRNFEVGDYSNFSNVRGDQYNYNNCYNQITTGEGPQRKRLIVGNEEEETQYAEYHDVRRGDIVIRADLGTGAPRWRYDEDRREWVMVECECKFFTAVVRSDIGEVSTTIVSYQGLEKEELWMKDFQQFSEVLTSSSVQVLGYNCSTTPLLILHNNLVPLAHFLRDIGALGQVYLASLKLQLQCHASELWMDSSRGVLCRGPQGPHCSISAATLNLPKLAFNVELLQEDVLIRYLATLKLNKTLDCAFITSALWDSGYRFLREIPIRGDRPAVISYSTDITIAVASAKTIPNWVSKNSHLGEREVLLNGLTRFTLNKCTDKLTLHWEGDEMRHAWSAQSPMVFHTHGIPLDSDLTDYELVFSDTMYLISRESRTKRRRREKYKPIYLFVRPFPISIFWSFNKDGRPPIPEDLCKYLGLPDELSFDLWRYSFMSQGYRSIRAYQIMRGFDPTTTDFARHCGCYDLVFDPVYETSSRFQELVIADSIVTEPQAKEDLESVYTSLLLLFDDVPLDGTGTETPEPASSSYGLWSRLASPFTWIAPKDLDIPVMVF